MNEKFNTLRDFLHKLGVQSLPGELNVELEQATELLDELSESYEQLQEAAQEADETKAKYVSIISHELRIPMTSIKGYADLLRQGAVGTVNEQQVEFLNVIRSNVERMSALITNMSDASKLETGRLHLDCDFFPLGLQIEHIVKNIQPKFEQKSQTLGIEIASELPQVFADSIRVKQVISMLLDNANRYTSLNGTIRLAARRENDMVKVEVTDDGIGISEVDQEQLFTQFFRSEDQMVREEQGWGLSLAVSKRLIERMGGQIGVVSKLGEGSTFWFKLCTRDDACLG